MSTMTRETTETSVQFSLAELAQIEAERVREEDERRARARESEARARREVEQARRAEEEARIAADAESRARREREAAAEKVRVEAREQAAATVARIEAEAKARLEADNAVRAHELAVLRVRTESGHRRLQRVLGAVLAVVVCGGAAAAYGVSEHVAGLTREAAELREAEQALSVERDRAKATDLAALDKRFIALQARPLAREAEDARATAEAARSGVDTRSIDHEGLRAFSDALDALEARIEGLEKVAALDRRQGDLAAWAAERRRPEILAAAQLASARARATGDPGALRAYEGALDEARDALARSTTGARVRRPSAAEPTGPQCSDPHDPNCDLSGHRIF